MVLFVKAMDELLSSWSLYVVIGSLTENVSMVSTMSSV